MNARMPSGLARDTSACAARAGKLDDGTLVALHLWLTLTRQLGAGGVNGTLQLRGYGMLQTVDLIMVYPGGEVRESGSARIPRQPAC